MAKEAAASASGAEATPVSTTTTAANANAARARHGSYGQPRPAATRRRGHSQTTLSATDAHEHHLRRARALLEEMAGLGRRGRLQSSPAMLSATGPRRTASLKRSVSPPLSSSSAAVAELRAAAAADLDVEAVRVDTSDEGDDEDASDERKRPTAASVEQPTESIVVALALLQQAQEAIDVDGVVTLQKDAVAQILGGLISALKMAAATPKGDVANAAGLSAAAGAANSREVVERQMQRLFVSHANVFDEKVQNFIIQNFIQETDYAKAFRSAMRRTSLVKRCLKAMYPTEKHAPGAASAATSPNSHWQGSLAQRALATAHAQPEGVSLEACPDVKDPAVVHSVKQLLTKVSDWDFDLFSLVEAVPGQTLLLLGNELLDRYELATHFRTTKARQLEFLRQVQAKYLPNPYHNSEHAADVAQALHHFLAVGKVGETVNPRSKCAALVAALVHDVGHTSYTNNFHIAANDDLAVKYVYRSPLEHMHCALAFQLMKTPKANVLEGLTRIEQMEVRTLITDMVLATDNSVHAAYLAKLEGLLGRATTDATSWTLCSNPDDERLVLQMALHAADVSNPAKSQEQCRVWAERILVEFYQQGDKERELELPLSIGYDRENPIPLEKMQAGFILGIVRPLFTVFCRLPGTQLGHCLTQLDENLAYWQGEISRSQA